MAGHEFLALAYGVLAVVDNGGDERGGRFPFGYGVQHVLGFARAAGGDDTASTI